MEFVRRHLKKGGPLVGHAIDAATALQLDLAGPSSSR